MKDHFEMYAAYNSWANGVVYKAAGELTEAELSSDRGAFFGSMIATLNHLLCADRIWMKRFTGSGDAPTALNTILHPGLPELEAARKAEDERIIAWIAGLDEAKLGGTFSYTPISTPGLVTQRLGSALSHAFNHQTHHRGQCHMILTSLGKPSLTLDMVSFHRNEGKQWL
ncbi:DinB family protein [Rhizobium sp.]